MLLKVAGGGFLHPKAAKAWNALVAKAAADGIELKPTSAGDLYRSYAMQKRGFLTRYQLEPIEPAKTRKFEGKVWYLKKGNAPLASPGTSNHNLGIAIDVANASGKVLEWMKANIEAYGFSWELQEEPWHIRLVCGDNLPAVVTGA
jgi:LAS superfamily LD-carboxypeptidase LdcB